MKPTLESVVEEALRLPKEERIDVMKRISESLGENFWADDETRRAWVEEAERRVDAVRTGAMEVIDGEQILRDLEVRRTP